jgi:hypothetical protein
MSIDLSAHFPRYTDFDPLVPIYCVTPDLEGCFHRFFDTSPVSPSGRYLGVTRLRFEDRLPGPGDLAEVVLVDLETSEARVLAETRGWDTQLGAQVQWGASDEQLFFNDMDTGAWRPFGVRLNPLTGERHELEGTVYMVSPDGRWAASPCLLRTAITQAGYGVLAPMARVPLNEGASSEDGVYVTDTETGASRLLVSFEQIFETAEPRLDPDEYADGDFYGFHVKWNPQGTRIMLVLRFNPHDDRKRRANVITMEADGSALHVAIPASEWTDKGGHHPNWCPDGEYVMMNLKMDGETMRFVRARYDGSDYAVMSATLVGSGHPSLHPDGRHIVTDAYPTEPVAFGDGTTPIRLCDLDSGEDLHLARIQVVPPYTGENHELRVDPHPAWDYDFRRVAFNACPDGTRRVYLADCSEYL